MRALILLLSFCLATNTAQNYAQAAGQKPKAPPTPGGDAGGGVPNDDDGTTYGGPAHRPHHPHNNGSDYDSGSTYGNESNYGDGSVSSDFDRHSVYSYCPYSLSMLDGAILRARTKNAQVGPTQARAILRQGLQKTLASYGTWPGRGYQPLTREALKRALQLDVIFNDKCGASADICQSDRRALRFLIGYIQHIKQDIIPLDNDYYIPMHEHGCYGGSCEGGEDLWEEFVSHYKEAAISLLGVYVGRGPDDELPEAFGNDIYEMRVAERLFYWVSYDFQRDDLNRIFTCEINGLQGMASNLHEQLVSGDVFESSEQAVLNARGLAKNVLSNAENYSCRMHRRKW